MALETTLTDIIARLRHGRVRSVCHPEPVEGSLLFPHPVRLHTSTFIPHPFRPGWLVATNLNNILKKTIIKLAAEVAGLSFGKGVIVEF